MAAKISALKSALATDSGQTHSTMAMTTRTIRSVDPTFCFKQLEFSMIFPSSDSIPAYGQFIRLPTLLLGDSRRNAAGVIPGNKVGRAAENTEFHLSQVRAPSLVVMGMDEPAGEACRTAGSLGGRVIMVSHAEHNPQDECPDAELPAVAGALRGAV